MVPSAPSAIASILVPPRSTPIRMLAYLDWTRRQATCQGIRHGEIAAGTRCRSTDRNSVDRARALRSSYHSPVAVDHVHHRGACVSARIRHRLARSVGADPTRLAPGALFGAADLKIHRGLNDK